MTNEWYQKNIKISLKIGVWNVLDFIFKVTLVWIHVTGLIFVGFQM